MPGFSHADAAAQIALALAIGLLIGFEREWSNKDAGIRTCALAGLLGVFCAHLGTAMTAAGLLGVLVLVVFINLRALRAENHLEITTSTALILVYVLGLAVGSGWYFAAVTAAVLGTLLLAWKLELHRFAGELHPNEIRAAIWLGLLAFVIYPLVPNRTVDPWGLVNPHGVWLAIIVVAAVGFGNYVLMRLYSARGFFYSAFLGGLVNSTATVLELGSSLRSLGATALPLGIGITLLATLAMVARNLLLLALFAPAAARIALLPMLAMVALAAGLAWWHHHGSVTATSQLRLDSPLSLKRVAEFGGFFLVIAAATTLAERHLGHSGTYVVSAIGGIISSASSTVAVGELVGRPGLSATAAAIATVITSMASAISNALVMNRTLNRGTAVQHRRDLAWSNDVVTLGLIAAGAVALALQRLWLKL